MNGRSDFDGSADRRSARLGAVIHEGRSPSQKPSRRLGRRWVLTLAITVMLFTAGCAAPRSESGGIAAPAAGRPVLQGSIFPADNALLGNDDLAKVLDGQVALREHGNLAILPIGYLPFMEAGSGDALRTAIQARLAGNRFVGEVITVPRMLLADKVTVPVIREMGARLQAENVLVFTAYQDTYLDWSVIRKDELRVQLTVEAVVVNVRTGCIPIAMAVDKRKVVIETAADFNRYEFVQRALRDCLTEGILDVCGRIESRLREAVPSH